MISNINYKGRISCVSHLEFRTSPPIQCVLRHKDYKIVVFPSMKCRIMGLKKPLQEKHIDMGVYQIEIESIQSVTWTFDLNTGPINLENVCKRLKCVFEPELFPALRIVEYDPMCVSVFASGKCVVTGSKAIDNIDELIRNVRSSVAS